MSYQVSRIIASLVDVAGTCENGLLREWGLCSASAWMWMDIAEAALPAPEPKPKPACEVN